MKNVSNRKKRLQTLFWITVAASWLSFLFFGYSIPLVFLFWIAVLVYLFIAKTRLKWYLLLCSSWTVASVMNFMSGSKNYFQGRAVIRTSGLPSREFYNLNPDLRTWNSTSGCMVYGYESFTHEPNNLAVKLWTSLFGYQPGAYEGVYPTKQQAQELIKQGQKVDLSKISDSVFLNYNDQKLFLISNNTRYEKALEKSSSAKAFLLKDECLIIEALVDSSESVIILADKKSGIVFARYYNL
jgi:hypothetical protein